MRAFSKRLGVPASTLSGLLSGKLRVTLRTGKKILPLICSDPSHVETLAKGLKNKFSNSSPQQDPADRTPTLTQLDMDQFYLISDWYYFAILSLSEVEGFKDNPRWIARRLNIQIREAAEGLKRLERLQLLIRNNRGQLVWSGKSFKTTNNIENVTIRRCHFQNLGLMQKSMEVDSLEACDFSSMVMAIDPLKLPEAKMMITNFRRNLSAFLENKRKKEVYKIFIGLFPLSKMEKIKTERIVK